MADKAKLEAIIGWLNEKNAGNIDVYDVKNNSGYTDIIVVCEGSVDQHNKAIANHLLDMAKEHRLHVIGKEGIDFGHWILIDLADVVVHIFLPHTRQYYDIDEIFKKVADTKEQKES
ncbi:MAG: ribosome silencing factor [Candidatus Cloacimonetes bacterium]|nr:ribosome silencing factor [Candidatus Cloacimonadota bacterium]